MNKSQQYDKELLSNTDEKIQGRKAEKPLYQWILYPLHGKGGYRYKDAEAKKLKCCSTDLCSPAYLSLFPKK